MSLLNFLHFLLGIVLFLYYVDEIIEEINESKKITHILSVFFFYFLFSFVPILNIVCLSLTLSDFFNQFKQRKKRLDNLKKNPEIASVEKLKEIVSIATSQFQVTDFKNYNDYISWYKDVQRLEYFIENNHSVFEVKKILLNYDPIFSTYVPLLKKYYANNKEEKKGFFPNLVVILSTFEEEVIESVNSKK